MCAIDSIEPAYDLLIERPVNQEINNMPLASLLHIHTSPVKINFKKIHKKLQHIQIVLS